MLSASRRTTLAVTVVVTAAFFSEAAAQGGWFGFERRRDPVVEEATADYDGRFAFVRLRYGPPGQMRFRREPPWAHDFPRADFHFLKILSEITLTQTFIDQGNIRTLDDPELTMFPIAYMSEPGFWTMDQAEVDGLRNYLQKGGFLIFDDFREDHLYNLFAQMKRAMPDAVWHRMDVAHPIFHSFFEIKSLEAMPGYYGDPEFYGIFEDNDPRKRLMAIANYNHDLGEHWEFSDTGYLPVDLSNEAYKFGVNYVVYGLTH